MSSLEEALAQAGFPCTVESRDRLALVRFDPVAVRPALARHEREAIISLAREHGFTHAALLLDDSDSAALPSGNA